MMRRFLFAFLFVVCALAAMGQKPDFFVPYQKTNLRLPAVPIIVNDPYFSIWSMYDRLTDGPLRHWTDQEKPILGLLKVDGLNYRFMGEEESFVLKAIAPMADEEAWAGRVSYEKPQENWAQEGFDDGCWKVENAAWGSDNLDFVNTFWADQNSDIYIRREVVLNADQLSKDLYVRYSHDDVFELFINGQKVVDTGYKWKNNVVLHLNDELKKFLHEGSNVIAAHCHNTLGGAYADFGLFYDSKPKEDGCILAQQIGLSTLATNTYYTFRCGPVELDLVFTAPMLIDDYDLLSVPINFVSYQVRSCDGEKHEVEILFQTSPLQAVNSEGQATRTEIGESDGVRFARTGTVDQPILAKKGDGICIDWGYFYIPQINGEVSIGSDGEVVAYRPSQMPKLCFVHRFGSVVQARSFMMMGYDEIQDIEYFYHRYKGFWAHQGKVSITQAFKRLASDYDKIMKKCRAFDKMIYDDGLKSGGQEYAEILSGSYRHVMAAHKLFEDEEGHLLWFSKENNSNGCVNTVDLTYPEAPLLLVYNPELQKAMMTSIFEYSRTGRWIKPYATHDLGTYPIANGTLYGQDMPLEEAGNMLCLAAMLTRIDGNAKYVEPYWEILNTWADYLVEHGQDPDNQLCTDDFAGHWAHNCNLSLKAILGVAGFSEMARIRGDKVLADSYLAKAQKMAQTWEKMAIDDDGMHYRLAFDRPDTWSLKYNIVWDKLWGLNLFSKEVYDRELALYLKLMNRYGTPLDSRRSYTKNDWLMWCGALADNMDDFKRFVHSLYNYMNETESRVPTSDWYDTHTARMMGMKARSVIGGFWMKVLMDKSK